MICPSFNCTDVIEIDTDFLCAKLSLASAGTLMYCNVMNKFPQDFWYQLRHFQITVNSSEKVPHVVKFLLLLGKLRF